jgi:hypothetical protein
MGRKAIATQLPQMNDYDGIKIQLALFVIAWRRK